MAPTRMILVPILGVLALGAQERPAEEPSFRDPRDGKSYPIVEIGGHRWMARNLDYGTPDSFCYDDRRERCDDDGRLYRWETALSACPAGWHLATEMEWQKLETAVGLDADYLENYGNRGTDEGARLKPGGDLGFDVQYGGWRRFEDGRIRGARPGGCLLDRHRVVARAGPGTATSTPVTQ